MSSPPPLKTAKPDLIAQNAISREADFALTFEAAGCIETVCSDEVAATVGSCTLVYVITEAPSIARETGALERAERVVTSPVDAANNRTATIVKGALVDVLTGTSRTSEPPVAGAGFGRGVCAGRHSRAPSIPNRAL